jgi:uncharacterized protein YndB with AHSA1/START domain
MKLAWKIFQWFVALVLLLVVIAFLLPNQYHVERSKEIAAPPDKVWSLIAAPKAWNAWSPWYAKDPAMTMTYSGTDSGAGAAWAWNSKTQGRGSMRFLTADAPKLLTYDMKFEDMGSTATGDFKLEPTASGTKVTWGFDTAMGSNPLMRWFGLFLDKMVGGDFEAGLEKMAVAAKAG